MIFEINGKKIKAKWYEKLIVGIMFPIVLCIGIIFAFLVFFISIVSIVVLMPLLLIIVGLSIISGDRK